MALSIDAVVGLWMKFCHFLDLTFVVSNGQKAFDAKTSLGPTSVYWCSSLWVPYANGAGSQEYARSAAILGFAQADSGEGGI